MFTHKQLFHLAAKMLKQSNNHAPTLIVEFEQRTLPFAFVHLGKLHEERIAQIYTLGHSIPHSNGKLISIAVITEAWVTSLKEGQVLEKTPTEDPDHQERLLILIRTLDPPRTEQALHPIIRAYNGSFKRLEVAPVLIDQVQDWMTDAFIKGYTR